MLNTFTSQNLAQQAQTQLANIDTSNANISEVNAQIQQALSNTYKNTRWSVYPINPLSSPVNLVDLFGPMINGAWSEMQYHANRIDNIYNSLTSTNNILKSSLSSLETTISSAENQIKTLSMSSTNQIQSFFWVGDNFSSTAHTDQANTTALVDTDYGRVTLCPNSIKSVPGATITVDYAETNGIPGCNLQIVNLSTNSATNIPPTVTIETANSRNLSNMLDGDPTTWFEIERNFIPAYQPMTLTGRSWISGTGQNENVVSVTDNLDWLVTITWPNFTDDGIQGKGIPLADFVTPSTTVEDTTVDFVFNVILAQPTQLSLLTMLPYTRNGESITVNSIQALINNQWVDIAENVVLGTDVSTTVLDNLIQTKTKSQILGSLFNVPSQFPVSQFKISLSSTPQPMPLGAAHAFQDEEQSFRSQRNYVFFDSVDSWTAWGRIPVNQTPVNLGTVTTTPGLVGAITTGLQVANLTNAVSAAGAGATALGGSTSLLGASSIGWLGAAAPYIAGALLLNSLIPGGAFSFQHSQSVIADVKGFDVFQGFRSGIGIRDLSMQIIQYNTSSVWQSVKLQFSANVTSIGLVADQVIPDSWGPSNWIEFFLSLDGHNWVQIQPLTDTTISQAYQLPQPTDTCYLKATFEGNPTDPNNSAAFENYALFGNPAS